ncbi:hypothetical protein TSOC_001559 [Tetrabaena socialis]|uniref:Uncharacterized protein n=1 Tax=Tetrabaena socialis TaxID=47790 RepID=A0A2J8AGE5_9CHLO|nr:hypothetical protein TSOC_001559 [Tetrabaena socialis]|eukprot:PNH11587.1 hypothetical protein TSOC_001559 [Tetrabaena socialis]
MRRLKGLGPLPISAFIPCRDSCHDRPGTRQGAVTAMRTGDVNSRHEDVSALIPLPAASKVEMNCSGTGCSTGSASSASAPPGSGTTTTLSAEHLAVTTWKLGHRPHAAAFAAGLLAALPSFGRCWSITGKPSPATASASILSCCTHCSRRASAAEVTAPIASATGASSGPSSEGSGFCGRKGGGEVVEMVVGAVDGAAGRAGPDSCEHSVA